MRYKALPVGGAFLAGKERNQKSRAGGLALHYPRDPSCEHEPTLWDAFCDGFSSPEDLEPTWVYPGAYWVRVWDAHHIRGYFGKAISDFIAANPAATGLAMADHTARQMRPGEEVFWPNNLVDPHRPLRPIEKARRQ